MGSRKEGRSMIPTELTVILCVLLYLFIGAFLIPPQEKK